MKTYIKFLIFIFLKSLIYVIGIIFCLVFILNLLTELEFFKEIEVKITMPMLLALLNSPSMIFEIFPFIFLISVQLFFIKLFQNNEIEIFKYSGLKNINILLIVSMTSIIVSILITTVFYNFSSGFKNFYLEIKSKYTSDGKYLAVITNNGLWIKDKVNDKILMINSSEIENNYLINNFITEFDNDYNVTKNIRSEKIDISKKKWIIYDAKIYNKNNYDFKKKINLNTNFDYERIQSLYSNLSSLNLYQLYKLRENYKRLNYSLTEVNLQLLKLISYPLNLLLMSIFSFLIMVNSKKLNSTTLQISIGLFFSVIIYYCNNFFFVMGTTEKINAFASIFIPLLMLFIVNCFMIFKVNEK